MASRTTHRRTSHASRTRCDALLGLGRPAGNADRAFAAALAAAGAREAAPAPAPAAARPAMSNARLAEIPARRATWAAEIEAEKAIKAGTDQMMTIGEAASLLGRAPSTVRRWRFRAGTRPARLVKVGSGVSLRSVEAMLNAR